MRVVVVGHNVRNVAESAKKAGWDVFAVTKFADSDLKLYARVWKVEEFDARFVDEVAEKFNAKVVLSSGCEDLNVKSEVLGVDPKIAKRIVNKLKFYKKLENAGIPFPELDSEPPFVVKPVRGGGGVGVRIDSKVPEGYISQRFVDGVPCSVSLLANGRNVVPVAVNEILSGWKEMNAKGFVYCGNVTPLKLDSDVRKTLIETAMDVVELFDVVGSVGVDFVISDRPYVLEMNPRFQGSLDSVEWSLDLNLFELHVKACEGRIPEVPKPKRFACRAILFSKKILRVRDDLTGNGFFADIPNVGEVIRKDEPVISILASGNSRREVLDKVVRRRDLFYRFVESDKSSNVYRAV